MPCVQRHASCTTKAKCVGTNICGTCQESLNINCVGELMGTRVKSVKKTAQKGEGDQRANPQPYLPPEPAPESREKKKVKTTGQNIRIKIARS